MSTLEISMPRLSDAMEEGTILKWLAASGDEVVAGQELVEIEADKANMTYEAAGSGVLELLAEEGATLAVGEPIARLNPPGTQVPDTLVAPFPEAEPATIAATDAASDPSRASSMDTDPAEAKATPLARRAAELHSVDLLALEGTGPRGRITKSDVLLAAGMESSPGPARPSREAAASVEGAKGGGTVLRPRRLQSVIARRMAEAKATIPHFQVETEVAIDRGLELRAQLKAAAGDEPAPSLNDLVVKAAAAALRQHPKANGSYQDGGFVLHDRVNVGIAVAAEEALVVPTIADADRLSLDQIARQSRRLAARVRSGEVTPPELAGATFTVSNLGMFGMTAISPVINPPQAAILGVGAARPVLQRGEDGEIVDAHLMTLTLSCDHRILYGAEAAQFLATIARLIGDPVLALYR